MALEGADFWFPLTLDENWIKDHLHLPMLHMVMDADLSRFKTIVTERPGQLWVGSGTTWSSFCQCVGFSWRADWQSHLVVQGTDSNSNKITWINFHPTPSSCPLNVLNYVQPPLHCMRWRCKLGDIGCLNDESSDDDAEHADDEGGVGECPELGSTGCLNDESSDDDAEHADDKGGVGECLERTRAERAPEDATEASNLAIADDVSMLESSVPGVSMDLLPNPDFADPEEPPQVLNVTEILKRKHVTHAEAKLVQQVLKVLVDMRQATNPVSGVRCFELQPGRGVGTLWMQVPRARVADGDAGVRQQQRRAKCIDFLMQNTNTGAKTAARVMRTQRAMFTEAASRASILSKQKLGVEATREVMHALNASWSGVRALKKTLNLFGVPLTFASEAAMKEHVNEFTVPLTYFRIHLDAGKAANGKKTEALVSSCCVLDVLARDADAVVAGNLGEYTERKFLNDPDVHGRVVMHVLVNEDYGGESGKFSIGYLDVDKPCGDKHRAIVASYEALKPEDPKPVSNGYNYASCLSLVDGFTEVTSSSVALVRVGGKHAVVPKHTTRQVNIPIAAELSDSEAIDFKARAASVEGSPAERAAERGDAPCDSAELVHHGGVCLGVRAGTVCVAFRGGGVPAAEMCNATVVELVCYASMDLLALAAATGMEGQSACNCCWCRLTPAGFGEVAKNPLCEPCAPTRTLESQAEDAAEHAAAVARALAKGNKGIPPGVNGVKMPSLLSIEPTRIFPPYLHLILGLTNNVVQRMLADLTSFGCVDPSVALRQFEHNAVLGELEETVAAAVDDLVDLLDSDEVKAQVKHVVSEMEKVPTPAAPDATSSGIAAPTGAECVVPGQIALAEWDFLFEAADAEAKSVRDEAKQTSLHWLEMGSTRRAGDSDDNVVQPVPVSRKRAKANRFAEYAKKLRAEAEVEAEEVEAAVMSLHGAIAAFKAAKDEGFDNNSVIDEGFGVRALREAFNEVGISVQRYWNGAVSFSLP